MTLPQLRVAAGRPTGGQFAVHDRAEAEAVLRGGGSEVSPRELGIMGLGPASKNEYMTVIDNDRGRRPLRPFLPLHTADDDEFFDAPTGTLLVVADPETKAERRYIQTDVYEWRELSDRGIQSAETTSAGVLWASLFDEKGVMASSKLILPRGVLFSDETHYTASSFHDRPITAEEATARLAGTKQRLVSYLARGDEDHATSDASISSVTVNDGYARFTDAEGGVTALRLDDPAVSIFDRGGLTVIQVSHDASYGWERTYQKAAQR